VDLVNRVCLKRGWASTARRRKTKQQDYWSLGKLLEYQSGDHSDEWKGQEVRRF
jgi:hypothetical protein